MAPFLYLDSVRLLSHELKGLIYSLRYQAYSAKGRNLAAAPRSCSRMRNGKRGALKKDISKRENMRYDEAADTYTCYEEKKLRAVSVRKQKSKRKQEASGTILQKSGVIVSIQSF